MRSELTTVTGEILDFSTTLAARTGARAVVVYADVFESRTALREFLEVHAAQRIVLATRAREGSAEPEGLGAEVIPVPDVHLGRMDQVKVAVLLGLSRGTFNRGDRLVCLTGIAGSGFLDTLTFTEVGEEFEMFATTSTEGLTEQVNPEVFERVLNLAISLGIEGREGKPVGTTFVIGDTDNVLAQAHPMVLNPFRGYPESERNILDDRLTETVKEFAAIDLSCYLAAECRTLYHMAQRLGYRVLAMTWRDRADDIAAAARTHLWNAEAGFFFDRQGRNTERQPRRHIHEPFQCHGIGWPVLRSCPRWPLPETCKCSLGSVQASRRFYHP